MFCGSKPFAVGTDVRVTECNNTSQYDQVLLVLCVGHVLVGIYCRPLIACIERLETFMLYSLSACWRQQEFTQPRLTLGILQQLSHKLTSHTTANTFHQPCAIPSSCPDKRP
jgi:hypothetical protein